MTKIEQIKTTIKSNRQIISNLSWLTVLQFANYLIPLLLVPYIVRVIGVEFFGKVSYAQNIIAYFTILVNYGFEYSATQEVAINRENEEQVKNIFWSVVKFKFILILISGVFFAILLFSFEAASENKLLYFYAFLINIGFALFPSWFFQGVENMATITIFNFIIKLVAALLIVALIRSASDYAYYLLFLSLSYITGSIIAFFYVIKKYDLNYTRNIDSKATKKGFPIFINNVFSTIYSAVGLTMIGIYLSNYDVGIYSGAYKIIMSFLMIISYPITIALFPNMSRKFNESFEIGWSYYKKIFSILIFVGLIISIIVFLLSDFLVILLLGNEFTDAIQILKILSTLPFLVIIASMLTVQGMYGLQLQKFAPYIGLVICIFSISINYFFIKTDGIYGAAWAYVLAEVLEIILVSILLFIVVKKKKI